MTKELIYQLKNFEIFVEKMESFIQKLYKKYGLDEMKKMDLRIYGGDSFIIPQKLEDYFDLWEAVKEAHNDYKKDKEAVSEMFFDLYYNEVEINTASYVDETLWVYFNEEGFYYEKN